MAGLEPRTLAIPYRQVDVLSIEGSILSYLSLTAAAPFLLFLLDLLSV